MRTLRQISSVTAMNLRSLRQRLAASLVIVVGIAGVVAVLVSVLAMSTGMMQATSSSGRDDRAIVLARGASAETMSSLTREAVQEILNSPAVKRNTQDKPIASGEALRLVSIPRLKDGVRVNVVVRGVGPQAGELRPEIQLVEGIMFRPGLNEIVVGQSARTQYRDLDVGGSIRMGAAVFRVVGIFKSGGDIRESELLTDFGTLLSGEPGVAYNSVTVQLTSRNAFDGFARSLKSIATLSVDAHRESEYFAQQAVGITQLVSFFAFVVGGIMAVGALFAALNTMYSAVSSRSREIAVLRAIGFGPVSVVVSVLMEALLLAFAGGVVGALVAWLLFDGNLSSSSPDDEYGELMFRLSVDYSLMALGLTWACLIGFLGGIFPAVRAARQPVAAALRAT